MPNAENGNLVTNYLIADFVISNEQGSNLVRAVFITAQANPRMICEFPDRSDDILNTRCCGIGTDVCKEVVEP